METKKITEEREGAKEGSRSQREGAGKRKCVCVNV